jgi:hypothetical protein
LILYRLPSIGQHHSGTRFCWNRRLSHLIIMLSSHKFA